jgi:diguanylate cyclase (GGDEF)-like protein
MTSSVYLLFYFLNSVYFNSGTIAIFDGIAFLISIVTIIDLHVNGVYKRTVLIGSVNLAFLLIAYVQINHNYDFSLFWTLLFPIFVITLMEHTTGIIVTGIFYIIVLSMAYFGIGVWNNGEWNLEGFANLVIASVSLSYFVYVYESLIHSFGIELQYTRRKEDEYLEKLHRLSVTDPLTTLYNRRRINEVLHEYGENAKRYHDPFSLILFDVDNFKYVNDNCGHNIGDQVLITIANIAKKSLRTSDYIGRWGGEEFLILLPKTEKNDAIVIADKLRMEIENTFFPEITNITCSFGVAEASEPVDVDDIINNADKALYYAKNNGKNRVCGEEKL